MPTIRYGNDDAEILKVKLPYKKKAEYIKEKMGFDSVSSAIKHSIDLMYMQAKGQVNIIDNNLIKKPQKDMKQDLKKLVDDLD